MKKEKLDSFIIKKCTNCGSKLKQNGGVLKSIYNCQTCKNIFVYKEPEFLKNYWTDNP